MSRILGFVFAGGAAVLVVAASAVLAASTANARYERDVARMAFNDNLGVLETVRKRIGASRDTLDGLLASAQQGPGAEHPYVVVSIEDHRLWYKRGDAVMFTAPVATGSGKVLDAGGDTWKFETPRGRLVVQEKEQEPLWVPPDWHYVEQAKKQGLGLVRLNRGDRLPAPDGTVITVSGNDVVKRFRDGREVPLEAREGHEIVVGRKIVVPPYGTTQRKYAGPLGTHRLLLGDGYALHGTDQPASVGRSASHGCVRLRNEDIETLFRFVAIGTPVYIY